MAGDGGVAAGAEGGSTGGSCWFVVGRRWVVDVHLVRVVIGGGSSSTDAAFGRGGRFGEAWWSGTSSMDEFCVTNVIFCAFEEFDYAGDFGVPFADCVHEGFVGGLVCVGEGWAVDDFDVVFA